MEFWKDIGMLELERIRLALRDLVKFLADGEGKGLVYTNLSDDVLGTVEGKVLEHTYDFEDYKRKVNRYIEEHRDHLSIYKLRNNIPLTTIDYKALEKVFTGDLGSREDYEREYHDTPFGLLVRKVAKMEYNAASAMFSEFINDQSLSQTQIVFIKKIVDYVVQNGYIENVSILMNPPFDKPQDFIRLFDDARQKKLVEAVFLIKDNAIRTVG